MERSQLAAQLYTVRGYTRTPADLAATAARLRKIGYEAVQVSGVGPMPAAEIARILAGEGLKVCATHEPSDDILDRPGACIERMKALGCAHTAYPSPKGVDFKDRSAVEDWIGRLDAAGAAFAAAGMTLAYHNHDIEFVKIDGRPVLERIFAGTRPEHLAGELDTYWVHCGGGDVVAWCERLAGRLPLLHLKDYAVTHERTHRYCEIGAGNLDFRRIVTAAERSGCRWFIVEQDTCPGNPFDSLKQSFDYIEAHLFQPMASAR
jgi:sugar phosphate isomerase/epimerase